MCEGIFLADAAVLGLTGGAIDVPWVGPSAGSLTLWPISSSNAMGLPSQQLSFVPWWLVGEALAFSLVAILLSGAYPARVARLGPIEALRYE
jgi:ABC-type lipoprotein release transport system permease subunit